MRALRVVLAVALACTACSAPSRGRTSADGADGKVRIVAAFYPLAWIAERVGGSQAEVFDVTPPGAEPHDIEMTAESLRRINDADLIVYTGGGFQPAMDDAVAQIGDRSRALDVLTGAQTGAQTVGPPGSGSRPDPHIWLDPLQMVRIARLVGEAVQRSVIATDRPQVAARVEALVGDLRTLDAAFASGLRSCARRDVVVSHAAFSYLAARFGLTQIAITGIAPESEPSARRLEQVARIVKDRAITTVFFETLVSPRVAQAIARETGARTAVLNPVEGLTKADRRRGADYLSLMRANLDALRLALGCAA